LPEKERKLTQTATQFDNFKIVNISSKEDISTKVLKNSLIGIKNKKIVFIVHQMDF
jgi:hypothetical protein